MSPLGKNGCFMGSQGSVDVAQVGLQGQRLKSQGPGGHVDSRGSHSHHDGEEENRIRRQMLVDPEPTRQPSARGDMVLA